MPGTPLDSFGDFMTHTTGPAYFSGPNQVINDAQLRNFAALDVFSRLKYAIQGGGTIKDVILLDDPNTADTYQPGETATITNIQTATSSTVPWRFVRVYITWTEAELILNEGGGDARSQFQQYKALKQLKLQSAYTSYLNKQERLLVATASNADMEVTTGTEPYSIQSIITDDGLAPSGFTTVAAINPTTKTAWRNQTASYTASTPFDTDNGVIAGFDNMSQLVQWKEPPMQKKHFTASDFDQMVTLTNKEGRRLFMKAVRATNDITRQGAQDPGYSSPVFNGVPVRFCESYDDQSRYTAGSPGYTFINGEYLKMVYHRRKFQQLSRTFTFGEKPDTRVMWADTWCNLFPRSRQRLGELQAA